MTRITLDEHCTVWSLESLVDKVWGSRGNSADALLKNFAEGNPFSKNMKFFEQPRNFPPHTCQQKYVQVFLADTFPPIHSSHHNNKVHNFLFSKFLVRTVVDVEL